MEEEIRDNSQRSKDATMIFIVALCINIVLIFLVIYQSALLNDFGFSQDEIETIEFLDIVINITSLIRIVVYIVTIIFFLRWFKRAYGNLIRRHQPMEFSENGAVWGFFIPVIFFVRPYQTAKEIYVKTQYAIKEFNTSFRIRTDASFVGFWWFIYWVNIGFGNFAASEVRAAEEARDIAAFVNASGYVIISLVIAIISVVCVMYLIRTISKLETMLIETGASVSEIDNIGKAIE
ncbi:MAG: DUF4328 domain-containing protein [Bacteroidota bacterium]